jgi:hypothetical protein
MLIYGGESVLKYGALEVLEYCTLGSQESGIRRFENYSGLG